MAWPADENKHKTWSFLPVAGVINTERTVQSNRTKWNTTLHVNNRTSSAQHLIIEPVLLLKHLHTKIWSQCVRSFINAFLVFKLLALTHITVSSSARRAAQLSVHVDPYISLSVSRPHKQLSWTFMNTLRSQKIHLVFYCNTKTGSCWLTWHQMLVRCKKKSLFLARVNTQISLELLNICLCWCLLCAHSPVLQVCDQCPVSLTWSPMLLFAQHRYMW